MGWWIRVFFLSGGDEMMVRPRFVKRCLTPAVCLIVAAACVGDRVACATVVIDPFDANQSLMLGVASSPGPSGPVSSTVFHGSIVGGSRFASIMSSAANPMLPQYGPVNMDVFAGALNFSTGANAAATLMLKYNGNGAGLGSALAGNPIIAVDFLTFESGAPGATVEVEVLVSDGTNSAMLSIMLDETDDSITPFSLFFDFSMSGVDFSNLEWLKIIFDSTNSADFLLDSIRATSVPEPISLASWGIMSCFGVGGLWLRRRLKAGQAA